MKLLYGPTWLLALMLFGLETAASRFGVAAGRAGRYGGAGNGCHFCRCGVSCCQDRGRFILYVFTYGHLWQLCILLCLLCVCVCAKVWTRAFTSKNFSLFCASVNPDRKCSTSLERLIQESRWRSTRGKTWLVIGPDPELYLFFFHGCIKIKATATS